jgi:hypothetical protein
MVATYPLRGVFPGIPGVKKRTNPSVNPRKNTDDQAVACDDTREHRKNTTKAPMRLFSPHAPSDDDYHLGRMIYML